MRVYKKLFEVCQKYKPYYLIVHFEHCDVLCSCPASYVLPYLSNEEVNRIQKRGEFRHVYLRKEVENY